MKPLTITLVTLSTLVCLGWPAHGEEPPSIFDEAILGRPESSVAPATAKDPESVRPRHAPVPSDAAIQAQHALLEELVPMSADAEGSAVRRYIDELNKLLPSAAGEPASVYAILDARRRAANKTRDPVLIAAASTEMCDAFAVDALPIALEAIESLRDVTIAPAAVGDLVALAEKVRVQPSGNPEQFERLLTGLETIVDHVRDQSARAYQSHRVQTIRQQAETDRAGIKALEAITSGRKDPQSYTAAGLYLCARTSEWDRGTEYLSLGRPGLLKDAAALERTGLADASRLADAWWQAAESLEAGGLRDVFRRRAAKAYATALPSMMGLRRAQVERRIALAQPAAAEPKTPKTDGDADAQRPQTVVFLLDSTGTMLGLKWELMVEQVEASLEKMPDRARVGIVFFAERATTHGKEAIPLTAENREKLLAFVHAHQARGSTNPLPGIDAAFAMRPDTIVMLTDGEFDNVVSYDQVVRAIRHLNRDQKVKVNTYMFGDRDPRAEKTLQSIATDNNGRMFVIELERLIRSDKQKR